MNQFASFGYTEVPSSSGLWGSGMVQIALESGPPRRISIVVVIYKNQHFIVEV
jgi:hypothetical protein